MADKQLLFDILAKDRASDAFQSAGRSADKLGDATTSMGTKIKAAALVGTAAIGALALSFGRDALEAAKESAKVTAQTEAVIKSTGGAANTTSAQLGALTHSLQMMSGVSDETIQSGANMLLTFTNIRNEVGAGNDVFNQATRTLLDMSVATGTDASNAAVQLGKALNDPIAGVSSLARVGVQFTDVQKEQIATMVAAGDTMGAQKLILAELNTQFGGSAKAQGDAMTAGERLSLRWGDLQEQVGTWLIPRLNTLIESLMKGAEWFGRNTDVLVPLIATIGSAVTAVWALSAAASALNGVLALTGGAVVVITAPVWALVAAVAALSAGAVYAYVKFEAFRNIVNDGAAAIKRAVELYLTPARFTIEAIGDAAAFAVRQVDRLVAALNRVKGAKVGVGGFNIGPGGVEAPDWVPGFASGVTDFSGGLARVHKDELLVNMAPGTDVIPAHKTGEFLAGGPDPDQWGRQAARAYAAELRLQMRVA